MDSKENSGVLGAADVGANHQRDRIWIVARWRGNLPHTQHDRIGWWEQQQKGIEEASGNDANPNGFHDALRGHSEDDEKGLAKRGIYFGGSLCDSGKGCEEGSRQSASNVADPRCELWSEGNATELDSNKEVWSSSAIFNQSSSEGCRENKMADPTSIRSQGQGEHEQSSDTTQSRKREAIELEYGRSPYFWAVEPSVGRVADGIPARVDRLKAIGNAQVPLCAATAFRILSKDL